MQRQRLSEFVRRIVSFRTFLIPALILAQLFIFSSRLNNSPLIFGVSRVSAVGSCGLAFDPIYNIQGTGASAALTGTRTTEGVVVGTFQGSTRLSGYFIQDPIGDGNTTSSDGIFIYDPNTILSVTNGQSVRVTGVVSEFNGLTEITASAVELCSANTPTPITPVNVTLPFTSATQAEQYEGMLVTFSQTLTVSETYSLGRYAELTLSNGRLFVPTNITTPGAAAVAQETANQLNRIVLDDGSNKQNPDPILFPGGALSASNTLRSGYTVTGLTGALSYSFGVYRIEVATSPTFDATANPRPSSPNPGGTLHVAAANLLNYFNGDGMGGGYPTPRGAETLVEFNRQRGKTIPALLALNADIIGVMELENDGDGANSAAQDLLNGLNAATAPGTYAFIADPATGVGTDAIHVKLFYKPASVTPVGASLSDANAIFERFPVAQTFTQNSNGAKFSVIVNHFKSKGSCPTAGDPNVDQNDGQSCWNPKRVQQATELLSFIQTVKTASSDSDVLVMGDLNAYAKEDPITTLKNGGLINEVERLITNPYSYVFQAEAGYLDHMITTASLDTQVAGVVEYHNNADEPTVLDYNTNFKSAGQITSLYNADPYRASDHDPLVIGLNLSASATPTTTSTTTPTMTPTLTRTVTPTLTTTATATTQPAARPDTIGIYFNGTFYLRNTNTSGYADITVTYGNPGNLPVVGDWNGDGMDTIGIYINELGVFLLRDLNTSGDPQYAFVLGNPGDEPIAGRWDSAMLGSGAGVYRPSNGLLFARRILSSGFADYTMVLGNPGDHGIAGDWDGNGYDSIGVFRPADTRFYLANAMGGTTTTPAIIFSDYDFAFGPASAVPVAGDWTGSGTTHVGYVLNGIFYLKNTFTSGAPDLTFPYGVPGALPVAGKWTPGTAPKPINVIAIPATPKRTVTSAPGGNGTFD